MADRYDPDTINVDLNAAECSAIAIAFAVCVEIGAIDRTLATEVVKPLSKKILAAVKIQKADELAQGR
jgi:hypothetical protein